MQHCYQVFMAVIALVCKESFTIPDMQSWAALLGYGCISQVLAWILICAGMATVSPSMIGLILIVQPVLAFMWDILFFARPTSYIEIIGGIIAITGIYIAAMHTRKDSKA